MSWAGNTTLRAREPPAGPVKKYWKPLPDKLDDVPDDIGSRARMMLDTT